MATVMITGGTGMIGSALTKSLIDKGYNVIILTRGKEKIVSATGAMEYSKWDVEKGEIDKDAVKRADFIIHLAGAGIADKRWTRRRKLEIVNSRVEGGKLLAKALKEYTNQVKAVITASAIGWYGPDPTIPNPHPFTETDPASSDFLGSTCKQWEQSLEPVTELGKRLVKIRTGIVLSKKGDVLGEFRKPLRFGIATILGNGKQVMSWVHLDDLVRIYITAIENEKLHGTYNAVAPKPVANKELVITLAKKIKGNYFIPVHVPSFVLRTVLGQMSIEVLKSATVSSEKIKMAGFVFQFPTIEAALNHIEIKDKN
ncbi:MAG TPA: TIGR01777 family oxidoreductase [Chitinophagaceae bacterium]